MNSFAKLTVAVAMAAVLGLEMSAGRSLAEESAPKADQPEQTTKPSGDDWSQGRMKRPDHGMAGDSPGQGGVKLPAQVTPARRYFLSNEVQELRALAADLREKGDTKNADRAERLATRIQERAIRAFQNTVPAYQQPGQEVPNRVPDASRGTNEQLDRENERGARRQLRSSERRLEERRDEARRQRNEALDRVQRAREQASEDLKEFRRDDAERPQHLDSGQKP